MNQPTGGIRSSFPIGSPKAYFFCLFSGPILFLLGAVLFDQRFEELGIPLGVMGLVLFIASFFVFLFRLFQLWQFAIGVSYILDIKPSIRTPERAIGFLFIPFFNFYWAFVAFGKLPRDLNAVADALGISSRIQTDLGIAMAMLNALSIFPYVGLFAIPANAFFFIPLFLYKTIQFSREIADTIPFDESLEEPVLLLDKSMEVE